MWLSDEGCAPEHINIALYECHYQHCHCDINVVMIVWFHHHCHYLLVFI